LLKILKLSRIRVVIKHRNQAVNKLAVLFSGVEIKTVEQANRFCPIPIKTIVALQLLS
jgi:hypothetical protein